MADLAGENDTSLDGRPSKRQRAADGNAPTGLNKERPDRQTTQTFEGKVFGISGAARGIGLATARHLLFRGAVVSLADILSEELGVAANKLSKEFPSATVHRYPHSLNVMERDTVIGWLEMVETDFGYADGFVNCAGIVGHMQDISTMPFEEWDRVIGVNLTGVFNCLRQEMGVVRDGGSIVNVASVGGKIGWAGGGAYCAAKHGVIGLTKVAAKELGDRRVRVNTVCPAFTDTQMIVDAKEDLGPDFGPEGSPQIFKRFAQPEEIANMIGWLLSDESKFVTGSAQMIDGGWTAG